MPFSSRPMSSTRWTSTSPGLGPHRAGERLARGAATRATVEHGPPVRRRAARRVPQQGEAEPAPPLRRVHHEIQASLVQVLPGRQPQPVPARRRTLVSRQPHFPRVTAPADGQPAAERPLGEPRSLRFVDTLGCVVDLETRAGLLGVGQVDLLDFHAHSQPLPGPVTPPNIPPLRHGGAPAVPPGPPSWYGDSQCCASCSSLAAAAGADRPAPSPRGVGVSAGHQSGNTPPSQRYEEAAVTCSTIPRSNASRPYTSSPAACRVIATRRSNPSTSPTAPGPPSPSPRRRAGCRPIYGTATRR